MYLVDKLRFVVWSLKSLNKDRSTVKHLIQCAPSLWWTGDRPRSPQSNSNIRILRSWANLKQPIFLFNLTVHYSTVQKSTVQYHTVQCRTKKVSTVQYSQSWVAKWFEVSVPTGGGYSRWRLFCTTRWSIMTTDVWPIALEESTIMQLVPICHPDGFTKTTGHTSISSIHLKVTH